LDWKNKETNRILSDVASFALFAVSVETQQPDKVPRVGYASVRGASSQAAVLEGFRESLRELGYIEGKNIVIDLSWWRLMA
jgi:hypothetical protein